MYNNARITRENALHMFNVTKCEICQCKKLNERVKMRFTGLFAWQTCFGKSKACVYANDLENLGVTLMPSAVIGIKPHYEKTKIIRESSNKSNYHSAENIIYFY
jgi:hypothetical protein